MSISTNSVSRPRSSDLREFLFCLLLGLIWAMPCHAAAGLDLSKIPALTAYHMLPEAEFEAQTKVEKEEAPYEDTYIPYEIRLPKDWTGNVQGDKKLDIGRNALGDNVLAILGRYISTPKNLVRSHVQVEAQILSYEVSVKNWFINFILKNGFSLTALDAKSDREIEALYVQVDNDVTYVVRARAIINGPRLILVRHYMPQENFTEDKGQQRQIIGSFKLLNPTQERIEKQLEYGFLDQSYFNYPKSWKLNAKPIYSIERMNATLYQEAKIMASEERKRKRNAPPILDGQIKILVVSRLINTTLAQEVEAFRNSIDVKGYKLGKPVETVAYQYNPSIKSGKAQIYSLVPEQAATMASYEMLISVMEGADFYYITSMITPSREQDFYIWARNMESARIVNESIRRSNLRFDPNDPYYDYLKQE